MDALRERERERKGLWRRGVREIKGYEDKGNKE